MKRIILFLFTLFCVVCAKAQSDSSEVPPDIHPPSFEDLAMFPGGQDSLAKFIRNNIKYPSEAIKNKVEGNVFVIFDIEADGTISNINIRKGIGGGCDEEVIRIIKLMPPWKPQMENGKPIKTSMTLPVTFKLN